MWSLVLSVLRNTRTMSYDLSDVCSKQKQTKLFDNLHSSLFNDFCIQRRSLFITKAFVEKVYGFVLWLRPKQGGQHVKEAFVRHGLVHWKALQIERY